MQLPLSTLLLLSSLLTGFTSAFPQYRSLAGLSNEEVERVALTFERTPGAQSPPGPINDTSSTLVYDVEHEWKPLRKGNGLNTLANHGYLDRSGIATPAEIIDAVQIGFNMGNDLATLLTYASFLVDGNVLTNLMSIGEKSSHTGTDAPAPAIIGGLNTHGVFEGDASLTRGDKYFGNNFSFNETLFDQLAAEAQSVSNGTITLQSMAEVRYNRIQDSITRNPEFDFTNPRYTTAYGEAVFPLVFFSNAKNGNLSIPDARSFFQDGKFPTNFFRREGALSANELGESIGKLIQAHPMQPGKNQGAGNFVVDTVDANDGSLCFIYTKQTGFVIKLYPNPQGDLRTALKKNLVTFYKAINDPTCKQLFPYGQ